MPKKQSFGKQKLSLRDAQLSVMSQAPSGFVNAESKFPLGFLDETPRAARKPKDPNAPDVKNKHPERDLQIDCCKFLNLHPRLIYWATHNSIWVGEMTRQKMNYLETLKRTGLKKGIPDLSIMFRNRHGALTFCWAELKSGTNKPTEEQEAYMDKCNEMGGFTAVIRSLDDLKRLLELAQY